MSGININQSVSLLYQTTISEKNVFMISLVVAVLNEKKRSETQITLRAG